MIPGRTVRVSAPGRQTASGWRQQLSGDGCQGFPCTPSEWPVRERGVTVNGAAPTMTRTFVSSANAMFGARRSGGAERIRRPAGRSTGFGRDARLPPGGERVRAGCGDRRPVLPLGTAQVVLRSDQHELLLEQAVLAASSTTSRAGANSTGRPATQRSGTPRVWAAATKTRSASISRTTPRSPGSQARDLPAATRPPRLPQARRRRRAAPQHARSS